VIIDTWFGFGGPPLLQPRENALMYIYKNHAFFLYPYKKHRALTRLFSITRFTAEKVRKQNEKNFADQGSLFYDLKGKAWYRGGKQKRNFALEKRKEKELAVSPSNPKPSLMVLSSRWRTPCPFLGGDFLPSRLTSRSRIGSTRRKWCLFPSTAPRCVSKTTTVANERRYPPSLPRLF